MSFFDIGLYASLSVCLGGIIWRAAGWLRAKPGSITSQKVQKTTNHRGGLTSAFIDVLLLRRTLARSFYRWLAHTLILSGFTYLLLFHAMATLISVHLADEYWPTRDPWQLFAQSGRSAGIARADHGAFAPPAKHQVKTLEPQAGLAFAGAGWLNYGLGIYAGGAKDHLY